MTLILAYRNIDVRKLMSTNNYIKQSQIINNLYIIHINQNFRSHKTIYIEIHPNFFNRVSPLYTNARPSTHIYIPVLDKYHGPKPWDKNTTYPKLWV